MNNAGGGNTNLGCRSVNVSNAPVGRMDVVQAAPSRIDVAGWALDWDTSAPIDVHLYIDGKFAQVVSAASSRPDIAATFPGYGDAHGFVTSLAAAPGAHQVCTYAINAGSGSVNAALGCNTVTVP
jgi:hypothetical protein